MQRAVSRAVTTIHNHLPDYFFPLSFDALTVDICITVIAFSSLHNVLSYQIFPLTRRRKESIDFEYLLIRNVFCCYVYYEHDRYKILRVIIHDCKN